MKKNALLVTLSLIALLIAVVGCGEKATTTTNANANENAPAEQVADAAPAASNVWNGAVVETMDAGGYTYVQVDTGTEKIWAAGPQTAVTVGQRVSVPKGMMMKDFPSKALDRTFTEIYFVGGIYAEGSLPQLGGNGGMPAAEDHPHGNEADGSAEGPISGTSTVVEDAHIEGVEKATGGYTIGEIFAQATTLNGKVVKVRGRVVKFTANIMGTNWVHVQDGTEGDLTVTTPAVVETGDLILIEGKLAANKDFGAGYKYSAIIEKAVITKE